MQPEQCYNLLKENLPEEILKYISEKQLNQISLHFINNKISQENLETFFIPALKKIVIPKNKKSLFAVLLKHINAIIKYHPLDKPIPEKKIINNSKKQRDLDRLSRLLSVSPYFIPCTAVVFCSSNLLVALNTPRPKKNIMLEKKDIEIMVEKKWQLLREFLLDVRHEYEKTKPPKISNAPQFKISWQADFIALQKAKLLQSTELGGTSVRNSPKYGITDRLKVDLIKVAKAYLEGLITKGQKGFTAEQCQALEQEKIQIYFPEPTLEQTGKLHADQLALLLLNSLPNEADSKTPIEIGITMLCCKVCAQVLANDGKVTYRGTSGMYYPNTLDITTKKLAPYIPTRATKDLTAEDSESDVEIDDLEEEKIDNSTNTTPATSCASSFRLFKLLDHQSLAPMNQSTVVFAKS